MRYATPPPPPTKNLGYGPDCAYILPTTINPPVNCLNKGSPRYFVPTFFLSNVTLLRVFLAPKIDEVCHIVQNSNFDFICITESWLKSHIQDSVVAIDGLNLVRRDRKEITHGGVCMYIKDTVPFSVLEDLADDFLEVLWLDLRPPQLWRGVNNIIVGVAYHPPTAQNSEMLTYLIKCLLAIESRYSNCGIIFLGDVSKLDTTRLKSNYNLKQIIHFPTCGWNTLDQILKSLSNYYDPPAERPAFGLSEHCSIEVQPKERHRSSENKVTVKSRDLHPSVRLAIRSHLEQVDTRAFVSSVKSCDEKSTLLQTIVKTGLDFVAPLKTKIIHNTKPLWINQNLKVLIKRRERALSLGDLEEFRRLRNRVNRERKSCRTKYYDRKVEHLKNCSSAQWWTEIKKLSGMSKGSGAKENIILMI